MVFLLFTSLRSSHKPREAQKILSLYCVTWIVGNMSADNWEWHAGALLVPAFTYLSKWLSAALLWLLSLPSLCFSISARARVFHMFDNGGTHDGSKHYKRSPLRSKKIKVATLKKGFSFVQIQVSAFIFCTWASFSCVKHPKQLKLTLFRLEEIYLHIKKKMQSRIWILFRFFFGDW